MNKERFDQLFERYLNNSITPDELQELGSAIRNPKHQALLDQFLQHAYSNPALAKENAAAQQAVYRNVVSAIQDEQRIESATRRRRIKRYGWYAGVAAAALIAAGIYLFYTPGHRRPAAQQQLAVYDIAPGTNKATLTLANGTKIILDDSGSGQLAHEAGVEVSKTANGEIIYTITGDASAAKGQIQYNTLSTVKKEQYQIVLADGSHVWLNASSSLRYPTNFTGGERRVELTGEAYFEIAHNSRVPFIVKTASQEVEVLGTHFNINAYEDEPVTKTTLLEGSVRIRSLLAPDVTKTLEPEQQAVHNVNGLTIRHVDTEESVAWKNGYFLFDDEPLSSVMRKLSRWYDVEFVCTDSNQVKQVFAGSITRYTNVSKVLALLEKAGNIHFTINNRQIFIDK